LNRANDLLDVYSRTNKGMTPHEGSYPFVECATFADEIKAKGGRFQSSWHFVDTPYLDTEGDSIGNYPLFKFEDESIDKVIPALIEMISESEDYQNSFFFTTMMRQLPRLSDEERLSYALRLLIHFIGDIHQPLHATSRVDSSYPKGDAGGNFV
jgi:hypothetical protein